MNRTVFQNSKEGRWSYCLRILSKPKHRTVHEITSNTHTASRRREKHEKRLKEIGGGMNFNGHERELGERERREAPKSTLSPASIHVYLLPDISSYFLLQRLPFLPSFSLCVCTGSGLACCRRVSGCAACFCADFLCLSLSLARFPPLPLLLSQTLSSFPPLPQILVCPAQMGRTSTKETTRPSSLSISFSGFEQSFHVDDRYVRERIVIVSLQGRGGEGYMLSLLWKACPLYSHVNAIIILMTLATVVSFSTCGYHGIERRVPAYLSRFCLITDHFDDGNSHVASDPERD